MAQLTGKEVHTTIDVEKLDGSTRTYEVAWKYTWSKVLVSAADGIIPPDANEAHDKDGDLNTEIVQQVEGDTAGFAWNICEMACELTKPIIFGVDLAGKDYPEGFIPYGAEEKEYVLMYPMRADGDGISWYLFDRMGSHDGTCAKDIIEP